MCFRPSSIGKSFIIASASIAIFSAPPHVQAVPTRAAQDAPSKTDVKIKVRTADELPRHTYAIRGSTLDIIDDPARFEPIVEKLIADTLNDLETYDIADRTTVRAYYDLLSQSYLAKMDLDRALEWSDRAGTLDDKPQERASRGHMLRALVSAWKASPDMSNPAFIAMFQETLRREVTAQPYDLVKDRLIGTRNQAKMLTRELVESSFSGQLDMLIAAADGQASAEIAANLINAKTTLHVSLPLLPHVAAVYGEIIDANANAVQVSSKWDARLVELAPSAAATPVVMGIWDSGVDVGLFTEQLWRNPSETPNGVDDDRNGFVDDIHGIAFGLDRLPATGHLASLDGLTGSRDLYMDFVAASQDMQAGVQSDGVTRFQQYYSALRGADLENFGDDMNLIGNYVHGTIVAGVAVAGNPFARILHVTENWPWKAFSGPAPTIEFGERWGEACRQSIAYMKGANTRVVNMSWRIGRPMIESLLAAASVGATPEERAELSRRIFSPLRKGLEDAMRSAPDVLFIAGSGNEDNDVDFAEYVPAGLRLPNLLTVGAVDDQDRFTTFTSTGDNVELYANGYRIPSMVPGGRVIPFSGTSIAAPQVANLAAKILAMRPDFKPADVIATIRANADPIPDRPGRFIINPKRTIESLQTR